MELQILTQLEESGLKKQAEDVAETVDSSLANRIEQKIEDAKATINNMMGGGDGGAGQGGQGGSSGGGGGGIGDVMSGMFESLGDIGKKFGSLLKMAGKIAGAVFAVVSLASAFSAVFDMLSKLTKMVGQFLRPIADTFMVLIQPVFSLLRPILKTLQTLMQPFRKAAMKGMAAANQLISKGMKMQMEGKEGGGALISEGFKGALQSASLMFSGFIDLIMGPLEDLPVLGDRIKTAMNNWKESAQKGVVRVQTFRDTFQKLKGDFGDAQEASKTASNIIGTQMDEIEDRVDNFTIKNFESNMETAKDVVKDSTKIIKGKFDDVKGKSKDAKSEIGKLAGELQAVTDNGSKANEKVDKFVQNMKDAGNIDVFNFARQAGVKQVKEEAKDKPGSIAKFSGGVSEMVEALWNRTKDAFQGKVGRNQRTLSEAFQEGQREVMKNWAEDVKEAAKNIKTEYKKQMPIIEKLNRKGLIDIKNTTSKYMGGEKTTGKIPKNFNKGMSTVSDKTQDFQSKMSTAASKMDDAMSTLDDAISKANDIQDEAERRRDNLSLRRGR